MKVNELVIGNWELKSDNDFKIINKETGQIFSLGDNVFYYDIHVYIKRDNKIIDINGINVVKNGLEITKNAMYIVLVKGNKFTINNKEFEGHALEIMNLKKGDVVEINGDVYEIIIVEYPQTYYKIYRIFDKVKERVIITKEGQFISTNLYEVDDSYEEWRISVKSRGNGNIKIVINGNNVFDGNEVNTIIKVDNFMKKIYIFGSQYEIGSIQIITSGEQMTKIVTGGIK